MIVETTDKQWVRLGECVKRRREDLRLGQHELAARGGPSTATVRNIEAAAQTSYRGRTYSQLEDALNWARGSVEKVLAGGSPTIQSDPSPQSAPALPGATESAGDLQPSERAAILALEQRVAAQEEELRQLREMLYGLIRESSPEK